jgi:hypothetical protein
LEAYCPGGLLLPVVRTGRYGLYKGSIATHALAVQAKQDGTFDSAMVGSGAFNDMIVYKCQSDEVCPTDATFESEETTPWDLSHYGVGMKTVDGKNTKVRHGSPESDTGASCVNKRHGVACGRCADDYFGREECEQCSGGANVLNGFLVLMLPFAMIVLYRLTSAKDTRRVQTAFVLVSTFGMGAFVIQTVAVFDGFAIHWPIELDWVFVIGDIFLFDMGGLSLSCLSGQDFAAKYWLSILMPAVIVVMIVVMMIARPAKANVVSNARARRSKYPRWFSTFPWKIRCGIASENEWCHRPRSPKQWTR